MEVIEIEEDKSDEIIEVNNTRYSLRKILEEEGWKKYLNMSEKAQAVAKLMVRIDLLQMELGFARLDKMFDEVRNDG